MCACSSWLSCSFLRTTSNRAANVSHFCTDPKGCCKHEDVFSYSRSHLDLLGHRFRAMSALACERAGVRACAGARVLTA